MWTQIVGKIRLALTPLQNHWWNATLYVTPRGLTTSTMTYKGRHLRIDFDFISHNLLIDTADGSSKTIALRPRSVADFYQETMSAMASLGIPVTIWTTPVEVPDRTPFEKDQKHAAYDPEYAQRVFRYFAIGGDNTSTSDPRPLQFCLDFEFVLSLGGDMSEMLEIFFGCNEVRDR
jgi:hypothetical protein